MKRNFHRAWLGALTASIGLLYAWVGLAAQGTDRALGLIGAVAIVAAWPSQADPGPRQLCCSCWARCRLPSFPGGAL